MSVNTDKNTKNSVFFGKTRTNKSSIAYTMQVNNPMVIKEVILKKDFSFPLFKYFFKAKVLQTMQVVVSIVIFKKESLKAKVAKISEVNKANRPILYIRFVLLFFT